VTARVTVVLPDPAVVSTSSTDAGSTTEVAS